MIGWVCLYLPPALLGAAVLRFAGKPETASRALWRRLVALVQRLGPTFIKGGQILSTRRDLIPPALCDALGELTDSVTPMSAPRARAALAAAYGPVTAPFTDVDDHPVATGSIASVFRGRLRDGRQVAIKLQRPAIRRSVEADLALILSAGALLARTPLLRGVPVRQILGDVCDAVQAQLDFVREAQHLALLRSNLTAVPHVVVPALEPELSRHTAIVMEFIPGLDADAAAAADDGMRRRFAVAALETVYRMLFVDGFVHCDLHRGNLYFTADGRLVVLDAGFTVRLSEEIRRLFTRFFLNMSLGNGEQCAHIVLESASAVGVAADREGFVTAMADLVDRNRGVAARDFSLVAFAAEMFDLQRRHGVYATSEIVFPLLSLLVIEGTIRDLHPDIDFQDVARPIIMEALSGQPVP